MLPLVKIQGLQKVNVLQGKIDTSSKCVMSSGFFFPIHDFPIFGEVKLVQLDKWFKMERKGEKNTIYTGNSCVGHLNISSSFKPHSIKLLSRICLCLADLVSSFMKVGNTQVLTPPRSMKES